MKFNFVPMYPVLVPCVLLLGALVLAGCGPSGPKYPVVKGTVSLDGKPLPTGTIAFLAANLDGITVDTEIKDGKFTIQAPPGAKKVEIRSPKVIGKAKPIEGQDPAAVPDITEETIPAKYNIATELTYTVDAKGGTTSFELKSN